MTTPATDPCPWKAGGDIDGKGRPRAPLCDGKDCGCVPGVAAAVPKEQVRTRHHIDLACEKCGFQVSVPACRRCGAAMIVQGSE